jgi:(1->4)-alpha-D-glucan 1-alpha-D-glucosylmutase
MTEVDLDVLCARHGIATRYHDLWGREHAPPESTKRALLAAMGVLLDGYDDAPRTEVVVRRDAEAASPLQLRVAAARGVALRWELALESGARQEGPCERVDGDRDGACEVRCTAFPATLPHGYHRLAIVDATRGRTPVASVPLIACPARCLTLADGTRHFGPAVQLYAVRSRRNWGIGDFTDLAHIMRLAAHEGASFVGVNPLHALFLDRPEQASPYSPSSRLALNPLYLDVEALDDYAQCASARAEVATDAFRQRLARLRAAPLVDYAGVAAAKLAILARVFDDFRVRHLEPLDERGRALRDFGDVHGGIALHPALFEALQAAMARDLGLHGWSHWPEAYRDCGSQSVRDLAQTHRSVVDFHLYLQWQADRQLARVAEQARAAGMRIGLYRDLAVGANPEGAETWCDAQRYALGVHVGAPPDDFNQRGQDWGLPPWIPRRLPAGGYVPWVALLRANMRHAGALRIDHVMGLLRLFWIPRGALPAEGTYVRYPLDDLLAILALESTRHRCLVVGEDLGTVPDEVRTALHAHGVHSYRVLFFEHESDGAFKPPQAYPAQALVTVSTHDLPTLQGFWQGTDLAARDALNLFPTAEVRTQQYAARASDRPHLARALVDAGLVSREALPEALDFDQVRAVHAYVARTPCALMSVQLEDVFGETEQVNLPATTDDRYPNWRRKIPVDLEDWARDGRFAALCATLRAEGRGVARAPPSAAV